MDDDTYMIWKKIDDEIYAIDIVFSDSNLEISIQDGETHKKVKDFSVNSYKDSLMIMIYINGKYHGYYYSTYISSNLLTVDKVISQLEDDKIKQLHVYLE